MIDVVVQFNNKITNINFPCTDSYLETKYQELQMPKEADRILFISQIKSPQSLTVLENMFIKMDELNYLAKRLDSFDRNEMKQYSAIIKQLDMQEMKDLINATFNLPKYTLVQDIRSMDAVGRTHILNIHGGLGIDEEENYHFAAIGKELMASGKGQVTEYGILFENDELDFMEVYDGQVFPEYYHKDCQVSAELQFNGKSEYLYMPCEELAVVKAITRLGATDMADCEVKLMNCRVEHQWCFEYMQDLVSKGEFHQLNELTEATGKFKNDDWEKFGAVVEYAEAENTEEIIQLARNLDKFIYISGIYDDEELGKHWIKYNDEYKLSQEIEDYFLFEQFGEQIRIDNQGRYIENGYVCMEEGQILDEILETEENDAITMGGM